MLRGSCQREDDNQVQNAQVQEEVRRTTQSTVETARSYTSSAISPLDDRRLISTVSSGNAEGTRTVEDFQRAGQTMSSEISTVAVRLLVTLRTTIVSAPCIVKTASVEATNVAVGTDDVTVRTVYET